MFLIVYYNNIAEPEKQINAINCHLQWLTSPFKWLTYWLEWLKLSALMWTNMQHNLVKVQVLYKRTWELCFFSGTDTHTMKGTIFINSWQGSNEKMPWDRYSNLSLPHFPIVFPSNEDNESHMYYFSFSPSWHNE